MDSQCKIIILSSSSIDWVYVNQSPKKSDLILVFIWAIERAPQNSNWRFHIFVHHPIHSLLVGWMQVLISISVNIIKDFTVKSKQKHQFFNWIVKIERSIDWSILNFYYFIFILEIRRFFSLNRIYLEIVW